MGTSMRALLILVAAMLVGLSLGAGMSWFGPSAKALTSPKRWHGKGPTMLLESPPTDSIGPEGGWIGYDLQVSHGVTIRRGRSQSTIAKDASAGAVYYPGCREVRAEGKAPLHRGQPGYREGMDGDGDGIACEDYGSGLL